MKRARLIVWRLVKVSSIVRGGGAIIRRLRGLRAAPTRPQLLHQLDKPRLRSNGSEAWIALEPRITWEPVFRGRGDQVDSLVLFSHDCPRGSDVTHPMMVMAEVLAYRN